MSKYRRSPTSAKGPGVGFDVQPGADRLSFVPGHRPGHYEHSGSHEVSQCHRSHCYWSLAVLLRLYGNSLKEYFRHHTLVFVAQQMTVEERYSPDDGVGEVHHQIGAFVDIEALPVFSECNHKIRRAILHSRNQLGDTGL
jgi:hypothetical protein